MRKTTITAVALTIISASFEARADDPACALASSAGVELGMSFGSSHTAFALDFRLAGESFMEPVTTAGDIASLGLLHDKNRKRVTSAMGAASIGARQYLATTDVSPYAGIGLGLAYL